MPGPHDLFVRYTFDHPERAAAELRAQEKAGKNREAGDKAIDEALAKMDDADRELAAGVRRIVGEVAPALMPKTFYGMPAWANEAGKVVVFFKDAGKFKSRYATLGFEEAAQLDEGDMWVTSFALLKLTSQTEKQIAALVSRAVSAGE